MRLRYALVAGSLAALPSVGFCADPYVIHISVDGLGSSYLQSRIDANALPTFERLQDEGAWTNNARTDFDRTDTLPNHTSQVTGRPVSGTAGHNWTTNTDPLPGQTLHTNKGSYVASVFDVAHDNGLRTAMYAAKSKFSLYDVSYPAGIDVYHLGSSDANVLSTFISDSTADPARLSFLHFAGADSAGHSFGWGSSQYNSALVSVDTLLGQLLAFVESNAAFKDNTLIVLTADHGGGGSQSNNHADATHPLNYTIPFYAWGPGVTAGADLYSLNAGTRLDPGITRPDYTASLQPIRNGDAANLELDLLGLSAVPGSSINSLQNLAVPEPASLALLGTAIPALLLRRRRTAHHFSAKVSQ